MPRSSAQMGLALKGETPTKDMLLALLAKHIGREAGVTAEQIAGALGTNARVVRDLVTELRLDGRAVCAHPATGYFIARTPEELEETLAFLRSRAMHSLTVLAAMQRQTLGDLVGQLRLKT